VEKKELADISFDISAYITSQVAILTPSYAIVVEFTAQ
jgi:hypothetical protein